MSRKRSGRRRSPEGIERDAKALSLRAQGASFPEIARALGISTSQAYEGVKRALADRHQLNGAEMVGEAEERLRLLMMRTQQELLAKHYVVNQGKVILDPDTGQPLRDTAAIANLVQLVLRIEESRRKLLGIDKPVRHEVKAVEATYAELVALAEQMPQVSGPERPALEAPSPISAVYTAPGHGGIPHSDSGIPHSASGGIPLVIQGAVASDHAAAAEHQGPAGAVERLEHRSAQDVPETAGPDAGRPIPKAS